MAGDGWLARVVMEGAWGSFCGVWYAMNEAEWRLHREG